jgi:hypothetical protein
MAPMVTPSGSSTSSIRLPDQLGRLGIAVHHRFQGFGGAPAQGMHHRHVAAPDVGEQGADGGLGRRQGDVDLAALEQVHVGGAVDQGDHLLGAQALRQQRRHDVVLVVVGEGAEHVHVLDVFLQQQVLVGGVAGQDQRALQDAGQALGILLVAVDQLHFIVGRFQAPGQTLADVAAAGDHDPAHALVAAAHFLHDCADVLGGGDEENLVAVLDHRAAFRHDGAVAAEDGRHAGIQSGQMLLQVAQFVADQGPPARAFMATSRARPPPKSTTCKRFRVIDQLAQVVGDFLLRRDDVIDAEMVRVRTAAGTSYSRWRGCARSWWGC